MRFVLRIVGILCVAYALAWAGGPEPAVGLYWQNAGDPTAGGGVCAPMWQLLWRTDNNTVYYKSGAACTAWTAIAGAGAATGAGTSPQYAAWTGTNTIGNAGITSVLPQSSTLGQVYDVRTYGAKCDGSTDDSTAVNNAIAAAVAAGGGTIQFPAATCVINSQITIPNTAQAGPDPCIQKQLRITGTQAWNSYSGVFTPNGGTIIILGSNPASCGQICTLGTGMLEIDHIAFMVTNTLITAPMFYQTLTRTHIHDNSFYGSSGAVQQIAIVMGGTNTGTATCIPSDASAGYGTVIDNNFFNYVQQALLTRAFAAGYWFTHNTIWANSAFSTGAPIEIDGPQGTGATINANRIEMPGFAYAVDFGGTTSNSVVGNTAAFNDIEDSGVSNVADYHFATNACQNLIQLVNGVAALPGFSDSCGNNTLVTPSAAAPSLFPGGITTGTLIATGTSQFNSNSSNVFGTSSATSTTPLTVQNTHAGSGTQLELSSNAGAGSADIREDGADSLHIEAPTGSLIGSADGGSGVDFTCGTQNVLTLGSAAPAVISTNSASLLDVQNLSATNFFTVSTTQSSVNGTGANLLAMTCTATSGDCYESITDHAGAVTYLVQRNSGSGQVQAGNGPLFLTAATGSNVVLQPNGVTSATFGSGSSTLTPLTALGAHEETSATAQSNTNLSSCGTGSPSFATGSTDVAGQITEGTTATGCTVAFVNTWTNSPFCLCNATTNITVGCTASATTLTIVNTSATGDVINYRCMGRSGGT